MIATAKAGVAPAPSGRAPWPWRIGALLTALAAGALLALALAHWGWRWFGPAAPAGLGGPKADASAQEIVVAAPFGRAPVAAPAATGVPAASAVATLQGDTRLLGVFAGAAGQGYALLRLPDRGAVLVRSGQDIQSGVTLEAVRPDGIRIRDRGELRDILLRGSPAAPSTPPPAVAQVAAAGAPAARPGCQRPPGFTGPIYRLNAELLSGMAAQPKSWADLLAPGQGGLVVREENGLASMLGMKAGDRFGQANGIALTSIDDVLAGVVKPLVASQPVRISGTRASKPYEWLFLNAGPCPA